MFFSAVTFIRKSVQGLGLMMASFVLYMADFPAGAGVEQVSDAAVFRLGAWYVPTILVLWLTMIAVIAGYRLDRVRHEDNLRRLAEGSGPAPR
ncbi:MAG: hypothetical protein U5R48_05405 [Gammaproteobacteria bacterium]|nr:hypothetical protein [Gammaproteobacteria bacterium]